VHQSEVRVDIDDTAGPNEKRPTLLYNDAWVEDGVYHGAGGRITVLEPKVSLFPVKKLKSEKRRMGAYHLGEL
jgi:hypothetical protein